MKHSIDILLSDYAGHAFTYELAIQLEHSSLRTAYSYCSTTVAPRGSLDSKELLLIPVRSGDAFEKYNLRKRLIAEIRYGFGSARAVRSTRPRIHLVANMPLVSLLVIWILTLPRRQKLVIWLQDIQSGLAAGILGDGIAVRVLSWLESFLLRRARRVIAISPELESEAERRGVPTERIGVVENWAPIESLPTRPRMNSWASSHHLEEAPVFLYSGTLARKHNPLMLVSLARGVQSVGGQVVVMTEGEGAAILDAAVQDDPTIDNLQVLPYQPFNQLPDVLATADVLVVLLEPLAAPFSVPSKTLSYLCAGRPIIAAMPRTNTAARIVADRALAGIVVEPGDSDAFNAAAISLADDPILRAKLGSSGRRYAEQSFRKHVVRAAMTAELRKVL